MPVAIIVFAPASLLLTLAEAAATAVFPLETLPLVLEETVTTTVFVLALCRWCSQGLLLPQSLHWLLIL